MVWSVLLRLVVGVEVEGPIADAQLQGVEGRTADEQVHVMGSQSTLGNALCEGFVTPAQFQDDLVDVFLVDIPKGARNMALDLTFQHDA